MKAPDYDVFLMTGSEGGLVRAARLYTGLRDESLFITSKTASGKPFFTRLPDVHFSVSHSGGYWACAFGPSPVGLDLQIHRECDAMKLSRRFFHPDEDAFLLGRGYKFEDFFYIWAAKESFVKYTGEGIARGLDSFSVVPPPEKPEIRHIPFQPGYELCICAETIGEVRLLPIK
ncbi:MAG: 4'-phosphopantetheinyl transferase family protein [Oscillospiraceae bacterium]|jgi:4'-phosphopantetheinyl transferase